MASKAGFRPFIIPHGLGATVFGTEFDDQLIAIGPDPAQTLVGLGGNDTLQLLAFGQRQIAYGDAFTLSGGYVGGDDILIGGANGGQNELYGDAYTMYGSNAGGDDTLVGGADLLVNNELYGDAFAMYGSNVCGDDALIGGDRLSNNEMFGDAVVMQGNSVCGDDTLTGGRDTSNHMRGDADFMNGPMTGGNDRLISGIGSVDIMIGDAVFMGNGATGGSDTFVFFGQFNGARGGEVLDFRSADGDLLEIDIDDGVSWQSQVSWTTEGPDIVVTVESATSNGEITLIGVTSLTEHDFVFV